MPNVELFGFGISDAEALRRDIFNCLEAQPFAGDMVVTCHVSSVSDRDGVSRPFIRVSSTKSYEAEIIRRILRLRGYDIEVAPQLVCFSPRPIQTFTDIVFHLRNNPAYDPSQRDTPPDTLIQCLLDGDFPHVVRAYNRWIERLSEDLNGWQPDEDDLETKVDINLVRPASMLSEKEQLVLMKQIVRSLEWRDV